METSSVLAYLFDCCCAGDLSGSHVGRATNTRTVLDGDEARSILWMVRKKCISIKRILCALADRRCCPRPSLSHLMPHPKTSRSSLVWCFDSLLIRSVGDILFVLQGDERQLCRTIHPSLKTPRRPRPMVHMAMGQDHRRIHRVLYRFVRTIPTQRK